MKIFNLFEIKIIKKVNIEKQKKIDECKSLFNSIDLKYANEEIEMLKPLIKMEIDNNLVLIKQNFEFKISPVFGRFNDEKNGFHIEKSQIGFIDKVKWEDLKKYQEINNSEDFIKFQKNNKNFTSSTICEFDIIIGKDFNNNYIYEKSIAIAMGPEESKWVELKSVEEEKIRRAKSLIERHGKDGVFFLGGD